MNILYINGAKMKYLLFFQQLEDVVAVAGDDHLLFLHRLQDGQPITNLGDKKRKINK